MHSRLADDLARLPELLASTQDLAGRVLSGLHDRPVAAKVKPLEPEPLPHHGVGLDGALARFGERWEGGFSGSAGPRYLGFVTGGATPASVAGDWLTSAYDQNVVTRLDSSAVELERETVRWLAELLGIAGHSGMFVTGATMSNFVGLTLAREWLGERSGVSVAREGVGVLGDVVVLSGAPHSTVYKALSMTGLGRDRMRRVPVLDGREAVDVAALRAELERVGRPAVVVANAGTVNTGDFDDLRAVAALKESFPFWLHVDAAFGGLAVLSREHAPLLDGLAEADSVCVDLHKWLNVPYDAAVQFSRRPDLQVAVFQNAAAYLGWERSLRSDPSDTALSPRDEATGFPGEDPDPVHLTPESSRRLRALAAWFSLTAYGVDGHREIVERDIACARRFGAGLARIPGVRLLAPVRLNVVCFAVPGDVAAVAEAVAETGEAFLTTTVHDGVPALRAAFSNWRTEDSDVDRVLAALGRVLG
ncbi:MAG TPA: pyridoxal-dependent decarboxylase [Actinophytocola sp.]|uniref:pyridoxal phosphate-dependent decarboxylase family protein n=1 Tax=Actinophytocola sp. TaxID=1872138 RepID=UPI002E021578|nr:pyridoxal-dependent decarboxylase [Actinophytocola sp.]